jgi:hypothetical protein
LPKFLKKAELFPLVEQEKHSLIGVISISSSIFLFRSNYHVGESLGSLIRGYKVVISFQSKGIDQNSHHPFSQAPRIASYRVALYHPQLAP